MAGVFRQYHGDSLYLAAFAASLAFIWWSSRKKGQDGTGKKAVWALVLAVVFVFNEAAYRIVGRLTDATTYYRFFWMLPVLFVIAYVFTQLLVEGKMKQRLLGAVLLAVCLGVGANLFFLNRSNLNRPKNSYGLDPDAVAAAEAVMEDWNGKGQPSVALDMYLEYQVRTYEPRIVWAISRKAYLYQAENGYDGKKYVRQQHIIAAVNEGIKQNAKALKRSLLKNGVDYLVIRTVFDMDSYLSDISVIPVAQSENYTIYKVKAKE